jgi:hypothetical protein
MKPPLTALLALALAASLHAQAPAGGPATEYTPEQLDQLVASIALYPDPLVALMLPASTAPSDLALAANYLAANGNPAGIDAQPWDPSVKGLAHYPDVLKWMNANADWTSTLGAAFAMQPADVMRSIQQMRAKARAAGTLVDTPQQQVDAQGDDIRIVPAQADELYAPEYDPDIVYDVPEGYTGPFLTFGVGYPVGAWLGFEWHPGWGYRRDWRDAHDGGRQWRPDPRRGHELVRDHFRPAGNPPAPRLVAGARGPARAAGPAARPESRPAAAQSRPAAVQSRPDYRGYAPMARPSTPAPSSPLFGGYTRGTQARDNSARGSSSRQAPVRSIAPARSAPARSAPARSAPAPARSEPAPSGGRDRH